MEIRVDARGMDCPKPVIETKKAIENITPEGVITIVDNKVACKNVEKLVTKMNCFYEVEEVNGDYFIQIKQSEDSEISINKKSDLSDTVLLIADNRLGKGNDELGDVLINGYIYTLTELEPFPKAILFMNSGVQLTIESSEVLKNLQILESKGVEILSCGTCLDYYGIKSELAVGGISNMYTITEIMHSAKNTIRI